MLQAKVKILFVEDDVALGYAVKDFLQRNNVDVTLCTDADEAWRTFMRNTFDLCVLDVILPGRKSGIDLAKNIRGKNTDIPIILASGKDMEDDRIKGLSAGADDYITKPYNLQLLLMKINVFMKRRYNWKDTDGDLVMIGEFSFDYANLILKTKDIEHQLTSKEADLVRYLSQNPNRLIKREDLLTSIWGKDDYFLGRSMDVFITKIRKYFKSQNFIKLQTVHGVGYKFINKYAA